MCGGERCGMAVPEPDDGDAGGEVEVPPALGVGEPDPVAFDELDERRWVDPKQRILGDRAHASTAV